MRKISIVLMVLLFLAQAAGQPAGKSITVAGCVMSVNGSFKLMTSSQTYVLAGHHDELLGYSGKQVEVKGTVDAGSKSAPQGVPVVLHVIKLKKVADFCQ